MQQDVAIRRGRSSHGSGGGGCIATDCELVSRQLFHPVAVHHQHHNVSRLAADLGAKTAAAELDCRGTSPHTSATADRETATVLAAHQKGSFLEPGDDHHTLGFLQKISRYALVRSRQNFMKHCGCGPQSVVRSLLLTVE